MSASLRAVPAFLLACLIGLLGLLANGCAATDHVYLTWQSDPATTMTVNFQSLEEYPDLTLHYDTVSRNAQPAEYQFTAQGESSQIPGLADGRHIHHIEATNLQPGTLYYFVLASQNKALTSELRFRPLPPRDEPIRFIAGGDMSILPRADQLTRLAGSKDPMFGLIGGDLAYANGDLGNAWMWDRWLQTWESNMVTSDGALIPMVLAVGNHEVNDKDGPPEVTAPFYYGFFAQGGRPYFTFRPREDTIIIVLDSGHTLPHDGDQAAWLDATLAEYAGLRNTIAVYHAPLYPSHRDFDDFRAEAGRKHWLPLFDKYNLRVALENHDHTFKRTKVLKNNEVAEEGTVYLGDGSFGVNPRSVPEPDRWYLEKASGTPHFWLVNIDDSGMHFQAISHANDVIDALDLE